jgi:hypothetical protein
MMGTLVHCLLAVPEGWPHIAALSCFTSALMACNCFMCWEPNSLVLSNIAYWHLVLQHLFCGLELRKSPPISLTKF